MKGNASDSQRRAASAVCPNIAKNICEALIHAATVGKPKAEPQERGQQRPERQIICTDGQKDRAKIFTLA